MTDPALVAPAAELLTVLHRPAPPAPGAHPHTRCGRIMDTAGLWIGVPAGTAPVCPGCDGHTADQEELF